MAKKIQMYGGLLAATLIAAATAVPASALDLGDRSKGLGVSVSVGSKAGGLGVGVGTTVGRSNGINADSNTSIGGSGGLVDSKTTASVGGSRGVNSNVDANVGGSGGLVDAKAKATVGGSRGLNANVGLNVGGTTGLGIDLGIGGPGTPGNPGGPDGPGIDPSNPPAVIASMSDSKLMRMERRCADVLSSHVGFDRDLRELCLLLKSIRR